MDGAQFMNARDVKTVADAKRIVQERGIDYVKVGIFDVDGIMRGKYMSREKFFSALDGGFGFCDVVLGWDSNDQLYDSATYTGWHTAYPDAPVRIIPESCRELPMEENSILFLGEFERKGGNGVSAWRVAPGAGPRRQNGPESNGGL